MATVPVNPLISVDEYLNTSYEQDKEFVDGRLIDKGMPTIYHQLLSAILLRWFEHFEDRGFMALADVRTQIVERARYRLPDVMVFSLPVAPGRIMTKVPDVVIEILSPDDRVTENIHRFRDYRSAGVPHIIQMDPEEHIAWRFEADSLIVTDFGEFVLPGNRVLPFDSQAIFQLLRQKVSRMQTG